MERLRTKARELGFDAVGIADAAAPWEAGGRLKAFLEQGRHGDMEWMALHAVRREHPRSLWPEAKSAVVVGLSYAPSGDPRLPLAVRDQGAVSVYAARRDYHDALKAKLKELAGWLAKETGAEVKVFVD